jgi:hypothetical protein
MALKLGPTGLGFGIDKDRQDFTIYSGGWAMGRVYEQRGRPDSMRWFWSLHGIFGKPADMRADDHAATLDGAKAQFESIWRRRLAWAKLQEMPLARRHPARDLRRPARPEAMPPAGHEAASPWA